MSDDGAIEIRVRAWSNAATVTWPMRFVIRHTSRSWFRLSRADRNRLRRGEPCRDSVTPYYRRTRKMRAALARHASSP